VVAGFSVNEQIADPRALALGLACSVSLSPIEKSRVLAGVSRMKTSQLQQLVEIWDEEAQKFHQLEETHAATLKKLVLQHEAEFVGWLRADGEIPARQTSVESEPPAPIEPKPPAPRNSAEVSSVIQHHFAAEWLRADPTLSTAFERTVVAPFLGNVVDWPAAAAQELASGLVTSISLSLDEKRRIVDSVPKLKRNQLEELLRIFSGERDKFLALGARHAPHLLKLVRQHRGEMLGWLVPGRVAYWGVARETLEGVWSGMCDKGTFDGTVLRGDPWVDTVWRQRAKVPLEHTGLQCARPIFTIDDLEDLEPL
jgi:hypothetical protein